KHLHCLMNLKHFGICVCWDWMFADGMLDGLMSLSRLSSLSIDSRYAGSDYADAGLFYSGLRLLTNLTHLTLLFGDVILSDLPLTELQKIQRLCLDNPIADNEAFLFPALTNLTDLTIREEYLEALISHCGGILQVSDICYVPLASSAYR
ncbi:MAG: hypothetical protein MI865_09035, partial [Proteobacteria bacterium]|nr:hypothetical protein [Pseudomonadota bacterium]